MSKRREGRKPERALKRGLLLAADEQVLRVERPSRGLTLPKYLATLGFYGIWRKRHISALTNRRLLLGKGLVRREERSIPLGRVRDASFSRRGVASYVNVIVGRDRGAYVERIGPLAARRAREVAASIQHHLL